jgi:hypothetical protein
MRYAAEVVDASLDCRSEAHCRQAAAIVEQHFQPNRQYVHVDESQMSNPPRDNSWRLTVESCDPEAWDEVQCRTLWFALTPHLKSGAIIEFLGEDGYRWRVRWQDSRVYEEYPKHIEWALLQELTAETICL